MPVAEGRSAVPDRSGPPGSSRASAESPAAVVDVTVLIPALDEGRNLAILLPQLKAILNRLQLRYEIFLLTRNADDAHSRGGTSSRRSRGRAGRTGIRRRPRHRFRSRLGRLPVDDGRGPLASAGSRRASLAATRRGRRDHRVPLRVRRQRGHGFLPLRPQPRAECHVFARAGRAHPGPVERVSPLPKRRDPGAAHHQPRLRRAAADRRAGVRRRLARARSAVQLPAARARQLERARLPRRHGLPAHVRPALEAQKLDSRRRLRRPRA